MFFRVRVGDLFPDPLQELAAAKEAGVRVKFILKRSSPWEVNSNGGKILTLLITALDSPGTLLDERPLCKRIVQHISRKLFPDPDAAPQAPCHVRTCALMLQRTHRRNDPRFLILGVDTHSSVCTDAFEQVLKQFFLEDGIMRI